MVGYQGCSLNFQGSEGNCHGNQIPAKTDKIAIKKASVLYKVSSQFLFRQYVIANIKFTYAD